VVALAGDIDLKTAREKMEKYFGDLPPGPPVARHQAWTAKMTGTHRSRLQDRVPQARLHKVWNIPKFGDTDTNRLDLVSDLLAQGKSSRLYKRLVYDDQIATNVGAYVDPNEIAGQFMIMATARPGVDLAKIEAAIDEELARFLASGPTPEELQRVKTQYAANFVRGLERVGGFGGKSDVLAQNEVFTGNPETYKKTLADHANATPDEVRDAARRWLSDGVFVLEVTPFPNYAPATAGVDRSKLPVPGAPPEAKPPKIQRAALSNGLKILLTERHELPLVNLWLTFDAGYAADQLGIPGAARLTGTMLTNGTTTRDALQISDELRSLGAHLNAGSSLDSSYVRLSALRPKLDDTLALFADVVLNPNFPASDFEREKKQLLASIEQEQAEPYSMALRVLPGLIYGKNHAYGNPLTGSGTPESVGRITREDLVKFHHTWFHPNNATLIAVGDITMDELKSRLEKQFAGWKQAAPPAKNLAQASLAAKPVVYLIDRPGSQQSLIFTGHAAPPRNNPQEIAINLMNDMVGGTFSSRLNMNLREDKHWSYGSFSYFIDAKGQSPFIAIAPVQTDKTKESLTEMNREFRDMIGGKPFNEKELTDARNNRVLSLPGSFETSDGVASAVQTLAVFGFPDDYYNSYAAKLKALTTGDVNDAAKSVLHPDSLIWVVVGDRAKVEAGIRELNLGELKHLDVNGNPVQ
jgi:zinc protease